MIGNAIKFCAPGVVPRVHLRAEQVQDSDDWRFDLRDNGIGIDPQYFDRVFIIFQRLHGREEYAGTGIGLAICKRIVERHGGRIWMDSLPGQGTTFHFILQGGSKRP